MKMYWKLNKNYTLTYKKLYKKHQQHHKIKIQLYNKYNKQLQKQRKKITEVYQNLIKQKMLIEM